MDEARRKKLEANGFKVATVAEFLGLTPEESALIEMRVALSAQIRKKRTAAKMTQVELGERVKVRQPRVAQIERADKSVSLDLLMRAALAAGATQKDIAKAISDSAKTVA